MTSARRPRLLDLFCGAGGCSVGYHRAGFEVVGVDHRPQPRYPFEFHQVDALEYLASLIASREVDNFDLIHCSPPCQTYSATRSIRGNGHKHPDLVAATRRLLIASGRPYVIENVPGAPLINSLILCGTMFPGLRVIRHRLFECCPEIYFSPAACSHWGRPVPASMGRYHTLKNQDFMTIAGRGYSLQDGRRAMGIDWMSRDEMAQAIPPAYCEFIGRQMLAQIQP